MIVETLIVGPLAVNCYILGCERTREALVVDPGDEADAILAALQDKRLALKAIANTHAHFDHLGAVQPLKEATGAPFYLHQADLPLVSRYPQQALYFGLRPGAPPQVDRFLNEGDEIVFGDEKLRVLHTPGHTPGGVSFAGAGVVFVGDELFLDSIGRSDLLGGNDEALLAAVRAKLFPLGDDVVVYPGHGPKTTIGHERLHNPFFQ